MKLVDLIKYLMNPEKLDNFLQNQGLNTDSEALLIYMQEYLNVEAEISILEIEETEDDLVFEKEGIRYIQLFPIEYAIDLIENDLNLKGKGYSDLEIAERLIKYRNYDA